MKITVVLLVATLGWLAGCTIEQPANLPDTATPTATIPQQTVIPRSSTNSRENQFLDAIHTVHEGTVYVSDRELLDAGWATCEGVAAGATANDIADIINESASNTDTFNLLVELTVAALMFLCPEYEHILRDLDTV